MKKHELQNTLTEMKSQLRICASVYESNFEDALEKFSAYHDMYWTDCKEAHRAICAYRLFIESFDAELAKELDTLAEKLFTKLMDKLDTLLKGGV